MWIKTDPEAATYLLKRWIPDARGAVVRGSVYGEYLSSVKGEPIGRCEFYALVQTLFGPGSAFQRGGRRMLRLRRSRRGETGVPTACENACRYLRDHWVFSRDTELPRGAIYEEYADAMRAGGVSPVSRRRFYASVRKVFGSTVEHRMAHERYMRLRPAA